MTTIFNALAPYKCSPLVLPDKKIPFASCFCTEDRPLTKQTHPSSFSHDDLFAIPYDTSHFLWFEDAENDDHYAIALLPNPLTLIAEKHGKREGEWEKTSTVLQALGKKNAHLFKGEAASIPQLIAWLKTTPDHSLPVLITGPSPTFAALAEQAPELFAQKIKHIVAMGGFTKRKCEYGQNKGQDCFYTAHNLSTDIPAARSLFTFAEQQKIQTFVISTDQLRLGRHLNFDLPHKIRQMEALPISQVLLADMEDWNRMHVKEGFKKKLEELAEKSGYSGLDVMKYEMTPADPIAAVFALALPILQVRSKGICSISISDEPRYEQNKEGVWKETQHRATSFANSEDSPIRIVEEFNIGGAKDTTHTVEILINHLTNLLWYQQIQPGVPMSMSISSQHRPISLQLPQAGVRPIESKEDELPVVASSQPVVQGSAEARAKVKEEVQLQLPKSISLETLNRLNPKMGEVKVATELEIWDAVKEKDLFRLRILFEETQEAEWVAKTYNCALRDQFLKAFTVLQKSIKPEENPLRKKELELFVTQGRLAESVCTHSELPTRFLDIFDPKYGAKIMELAKGRVHLRPGDVVPGTGRLLGEFKKDQVDIELDRPPLMAERRALHITIMQEGFDRLQEISNSLAEDKTPGTQSLTILRGMIGSGKTTFLNHKLGFDESTIPAPDTIKKQLGGPLTHHESIAVVKQLEELGKFLDHRLDIKTNVRKDNTGDIEELAAAGKINLVVHDIFVSEDTVRARLENRVKEGGRQASEQEIVDGLSDSRKNREGIIAAAYKHPTLEWHLYDNNNPHDRFSEVAHIKEGKLTVFNQKLLDAMVREDEVLARAIKPAQAV